MVEADHVLARLARMAHRARNLTRSAERALLVLALGAFVVTAVIAWANLPVGIGPWRWRVLVGAGALGLVTVVVNAREFLLSARMLDHDVAILAALRVSALGGAANLMPLPGAALVRTRALYGYGNALPASAGVTAAVGIVWVGAAAVLAGGMLVGTTFTRLGMVFGLAGLMAIGGTAWVLSRALEFVRVRHLVELVLLELGSVMLSGVRLYLVGLGMGLQLRLEESIAINLGAILSHVAVVVPGGLGVRELLGGTFGVLVGVPASLAIMVTAGDRLVAYAGLALVVVVLVARPHDEDRSIGQNS